MTVYRVENKINMGPFKKGLPHLKTKDWRATTPQVDNVKMSPNLYCGCQSIGDLRSWFPVNNYSALLLFGYNSYEMEIDNSHVKICPTTKQVVFKRDKIIKKNSINLY